MENDVYIVNVTQKKSVGLGYSYGLVANPKNNFQKSFSGLIVFD